MFHGKVATNLISQCCALWAALVLVTGCGQGGGGSLTTSDPAAGAFAGFVLDEDGQPVTGARVSVDGVEAAGLTDARGYFLVKDPSLAVAATSRRRRAAAASAGVPEISVLAPGYAPFVASLEVDRGDLASIDLVRSHLEPELTIVSPTGEKTFVVPQGCEQPAVLVEGFARLRPEPGFRLDVVLVIDHSGSTARQAFDVDGDGAPNSVLDAEVAAARCFVGGLDLNITRVGVIHFNDEAVVLAAFTRELEAVEAALDQAGPADGGTNFEAALRAATGLFLALDDADAAESSQDEADVGPPAAPARAVVFLTDGIPTAHGIPRDFDDSNLTQSADDRRAAIAAADELGAETSALLFGYAIIPRDDSNSTRTTLPHCVAACGGGRFESIESAELLNDTLCGQPLLGLLSVTIVNQTAGLPAVTAALAPDGFFSALVPATRPESGPGAEPETHTITVNLTAFEGDVSRSTEVSVTVRLVSEDAVTGDEPSAQAALVPVRDQPVLHTPGGQPLAGTELRDFLAGASEAEFEDAVELAGVETFAVASGAGGSEAPVTLSVDFVFKEACFRSDFGYVVIDPENPPQSAREALQGVTAAQILFNSGNIGGGDCNLHSIPAGEARFEVEFPTGSVLAFFILPNRTLADYLARPHRGRAPLFTVSTWNPGGFDQVLTFRSAQGRTEPGPSGAVESPGPLVVFAFEDIDIASRSSDQDFSDVVFTVTGSLAGRMDSIECGSQ
jgi:hypothetical protein